MKTDTTNYEAPEILTLGPVEELTFGGYLVPFRFDFSTGYAGYRQQPPPPNRDKK